MTKPKRNSLLEALLPQARPMALEQRFMFDAAAVVDATQPQSVADAHPDSSAIDKSAVTDGLARFAAAPAASMPVVARAVDPALNNDRKEVAFVDTAVSDYQILVDGVRSGVEVVLLDAGQNGLAQMALWAQSNSGYDAIHVLSHGSSGTLNLGNASLTDANITQHKAELTTIGASLTEQGDIFIYACATGAGEQGGAFVESLARLTHADMAASTDNTGVAALGGNWTLERHTGAIEASSLAGAFGGYDALLAAPGDQNFDAVVLPDDGGIRKYLLQAKTLPLTAGRWACVMSVAMRTETPGWLQPISRSTLSWRMASRTRRSSCKVISRPMLHF